MKIRIFALAKELGLDSKVLINYAEKAGVTIKNSALASISPEERDIIVNYIREAESEEQSDGAAAMEPVREAPAQVGGKVRAISTPRRSRRKAAEGDETSGGEATATATVEKDEPHEQAEAAEAAGPPAGDEQPSQAAETDVEQAEEQQQPTEEGKPTEPPIRREDYVAPAGRGMSGIREMKPRGTIRDTDSTPRRSKGKSKAQMPHVAAPPEYKQPKAKKKPATEGPAQKPDMKLTPDILESQSPLSAHLRKHAEQKERRRKLGKPPIDLKGREREEAEGRRRGKPKRAKTGALEEGYQPQKTRMPRRRRQKPTGPVEYATSAQVELPMTVRGLSEAMGRPAKQLQKILFERGQMVTINDNIDEETALELALELGVDLEIKRGRDIEAELAEALQLEDPEQKLQPRPPVVTILGHVDHGKTTLLDKIRETNVAGGEAGGITQHITAYQVEHGGQKITFVDTPGHAAFSEMRSRGANVTDIVVLVVAADDGVMPQTVECISHAKAAGVPILVALNKIDLPGVNTDKVLKDLAAQEILPSEWGGETEVVRTSAVTGQGLDDLLETIVLTAELQELKANPDRPAVGVCLEGFRDEGRGALAWLVVQKGTLHVGDVILCGQGYGRIRAMYNDREEAVQEAGPSVPLRVAGLDIVPKAGNHFYVLDDIEKAREAAEARRHLGRTETLARASRPRTLEEILGAARDGAVQDLPLIIKADTPGSLEALLGEIGKFEHPEVRVKIVHEGIGGVNESDVALAGAAGAIIIAFHVVPEDRARMMAEREGVEIRRFNIIYEVTETIKRSLEGLLEPERIEVTTGRALVLQTFDISRYGRIAGCRILNGTIERTNRVHVIRNQTMLNDYNIASLRREKDDVREVREGMECGIRLEGFNDVKEGDLLEAYRQDVKKRTLESVP